MNMKRYILFSTFIMVLLISTVVNVLLLERSGLFLNTLINFGLSAKFAINGYSLLLACVVSALMLACVLILRKLFFSEEWFLEYMTGVSIYLNSINLAIIFVMFIYPSVQLDGYSPFDLLYKILTNPCPDGVDGFISFYDTGVFRSHVL